MRSSRRQFAKSLSAFGLSLPFLSSSLSASAHAQSFSVFEGPLFVTFAADGAWDVASYCDPKGPALNNWIGNPTFQTGNESVLQAGNIPYANFGNNGLLFENHFDKMLVVNGVDSQTSAHAVGIRHNWSGRVERGTPVIAALYAAVQGSGLPLPFLTNGGYRETGGAVPFTLIKSPSTLADLTRPQKASDGRDFLPPTTVDLVKSHRLARRQRLIASGSLAPRMRQAVQDLITSAAGVENLGSLSDTLTTVFPDQASLTNFPQIRIALACMRAGLTASADLFFPNFDSHGANDVGQMRELTKVNEGVDFFWTLAAQLGLTSRMRVYLSSDFGRTPVYNDSDGKDHWPIGSSIFMQDGQSWSNRVVGQTHPDTQEAFGLQADLSSVDGGATVLKPRHLHHVLRNWLDIPEAHPLALKYALFRLSEGDFLDLSAMLELSPRGDPSV